MTDATLSRGSRSVTFPIVDERGTPLISRSFGKPNHSTHSNGEPNPRSGLDARSGSESITIETRFDDNQTALKIADIIKAHSGNTNLTLDVPLPTFESAFNVFPAAGNETALSLEYPTGTKQINMRLTLSRVDTVQGTDANFRADTPRASGDGPVTIDGGTRTISFEGFGLGVERDVGRPNVDVSARYSDYPTVIDKRESSFDSFSLTLESVGNAAQRVTKLRNMFRVRRGRDTLTLDFNGHLGMGQFSVMPSGSNALRWVEVAGRKNDENMRVPEINLRVVR